MTHPAPAFDRPITNTTVLREGFSGAAARADHDHGDSVSTGTVTALSPSYVGSTGSTTGLESVMTPPAGIQAGDVVLWINRGSGTVTPPWGTKIDEGTANAGNYYTYGWYRLTSGDLSGTWTFTGAKCMTLAVYRGVTGDPVFTSVTKITTLSSTGVTMPAISSLASTDLEVRLIGTASNGDPSITFTGGATSRRTNYASVFWATGTADETPSSGTASAATAAWSGASDYAYTTVTLHGSGGGVATGLILTDSAGTQWRVTVDTSGHLLTTAI